MLSGANIKGMKRKGIEGANGRKEGGGGGVKDKRCSV